MKKLIFILSLLVLTAIYLQACSKKKSCVCTDKDGNTETIEPDNALVSVAISAACDAANEEWAEEGGSCKLQ